MLRQSQSQSQQEQEQEDSTRAAARILYEQPQSKTLFFTTSMSTQLEQTNGSRIAFTGIYQCTLEEQNNQDDFDEKENCQVATKLATGDNFDGAKHPDLVLRNLQFDLSSLRNTDGGGEGNSNSNNNNKNKKNYLYANTHYKYGRDDDEPDWEIVRAELPNQGELDGTSEAVNADGTLKFDSVFRTLEAFDWNECDFDCCVQEDYTKAGLGDVDFNTNEYQHSYVRTIVRSFVVDEHTGDVFVSWEGFYKDCSDIYSVNSKKKLQWTIGVSRLKTEDPTCAFIDLPEKENNFPRCTEPVSIVYQSSRGREVVLSYGGLAVIPASGKTANSKRSFLLSVMTSPGIDQGELTSRVWAFPEGGNSLKDGLKRQDLTGTGTVIDNIFMDQNVWDGGTLRLHYNPRTKRPDHLCRTIYEEGIECFPISVTEDAETGVVVVESSNMSTSTSTTTTTTTSEIFLTKEQTRQFCRLGDADRTKRLDWGRKTTLVTGLDVQWNEDYDGNGTPQRIFFGCWGGEGGNGNFGSVDADGQNLVQVMKGAYTEGVLFLPHELEGTIQARPEVEPGYSAGVDAAATTILPNYKIFSSHPLGVVMVCLLVCFAVYKRRQRLSSYSSLRQWNRFTYNGITNFNYNSSDNSSSDNTYTLEKETGFRTPYMELQNIDSVPDSADPPVVIGRV